MTTALQPNAATDDVKRKVAIVAGVVYLFKFIIVVYANFGIYDRLVVQGNAIETMRNIVASPILFRMGIVTDLIYAACFVVLMGSLYTILEDVNKRVVMLATLWQAIYIASWVALTQQFFDVLRIVNGPSYAEAFNPEQLGSLSRIFLAARFDRYYGGLMFYALGSTAFNYLWYKSGYIPKSLAMFGIISCGWCVLCAIVYLVYPGFGDVLNIWFYDTFMAIFDITLSIWLLTKGLKFSYADKGTQHVSAHT
jgi:hypothetical protein